MVKDGRVAAAGDYVLARTTDAGIWFTPGIIARTPTTLWSGGAAESDWYRVRCQHRLAHAHTCSHSSHWCLSLPIVCRSAPQVLLPPPPPTHNLFLATLTHTRCQHGSIAL